MMNQDYPDSYVIRFLPSAGILKFFLTISVLIASAEVSGQIRTSQIVGFNITNMALRSEGSEIESENATGIHFGMLFPVQFNDNLALHPGILFTSMGSYFKIDTVDISVSPIYLQIPINLLLNIGSGAIGLVLSAGTYFSIGVGGNKIVSGGEAKDILFGSGENKDLRLFDMGINLGAGLNIKGILISAQYGYGLANLSPESSAVSEMKNRVLGISLTSSFSGK
jgi:hypothetical protein